MNPLDNLGNQLNEKDLVAVHIGDKVLTGTIVKIKEASTLLAASDKGQMLPGLITIQIPVNFMFHPQQPRVQEVYKMQKPPGFDKPVA
jgi:hypothetical protein